MKGKRASRSTAAKRRSSATARATARGARMRRRIRHACHATQRPSTSRKPSLIEG